MTEHPINMWPGGKINRAATNEELREDMSRLPSPASIASDLLRPALGHLILSLECCARFVGLQQYSFPLLLTQ